MALAIEIKGKDSKISAVRVAKKDHETPAKIGFAFAPEMTQKEAKEITKLVAVYNKLLDKRQIDLSFELIPKGTDYHGYTNGALKIFMTHAQGVDVHKMRNDAKLLCVRFLKKLAVDGFIGTDDVYRVIRKLIIDRKHSGRSI